MVGPAARAPHSLAASLGLVVAAVGLQAPAIMFLAFCYKLLHRAPVPVLEVRVPDPPS